MRILYTLLLLSFISLCTQAQKVSHKLGLSLYTKLQNPEYAQSNALKGIMVKGNPALIESLVARYRGVYRYSSGDISSVAIPYRNLLAFSQEPAVERIESSTAKGRSFMDSARVYNNIDSAQQGIAPLLQAYKGTGVIVGIIDGGLYFRHQDLRRANGNTRVLYLWDQYVSTAASPSPYGYGSEWDSTAINAGLCTHAEPATDNGHGTNVTGIAVGNGSSFNGNAFLQNRYTGTAPDADIIFVRPNDTASDFLQTMADAANYIYTRASQLGRPCVINTSVGTYYGSHDGQDLAAQAIDGMLTARNGRVMVASAGNAGGLRYHLSYPLNATDSLFTWFSYNTTYHQVFFDFWADTAQFKLANFAIGCDNNTPVFLNRTRYFNAVTDFNPAQGVTVQITDSLFNGSTKLGTYTIAVTLSGGTYHVECLVNPVVTTNLWRLQTIGQGRFDLWSNNAAIPGTSNIPTTLPGGFSSPNYVFPDSFKTIVSSWQCSDKVITVANYANRASYLDKDSISRATGNVTGTLLSNSSIGPTRDGRLKPDIAATGSTTTATGDSTYIATLIGAGQGFKVSYGSKHTRNGGTSMSSPIVAGVAALYLQKHPNASYSEVKYVLEHTAKIDTFTTNNIPNISWGWGKVNAFQALKYPVVYGCKDTGSANYNAAANIDTGGCIAKVYGCTDTGSINYNPSANTNNGACIAKVYGCTDTGSINYNASANVNNGTCVAKVYGCTDTGAINYNPTANVNNGGCIAKVYGITDSVCVNYNPAANVSSGTCQHVGIVEALNNNVLFDVIPNPFANSATIKIETKMPLLNASVRFYDLQGKEIDAINIPTGSKEVVYKNNKLASGIYTAAIVSDNKIVAIRKVVAE